MTEERALKWVADATEKLQRGEDVCERANVLLERTRSCLRANSERLLKSSFVLDATQQQIQLLRTVCSQMEHGFQERQQTVGVLGERVRGCLDDVEMVMEELKDVVVAKELNRAEPRLSDFVGDAIVGELSTLDAKLSHVGDVALLELDETVQLLQRFITRSSERHAELDAQISADGEEEWVSTLLEENNTLEEEVASLLESLANHYDQCLRGLAVAQGKIEEEITAEEVNELYEVLEKDFKEVPEVVSDIEEAVSDIQERCERLDPFLNKVEHYTQLKELAHSLTMFGEKELCELQALLQRQTSTFDKLTREVNEKCQESNELLTHYHKFIRSYYSLLLELDRRHSTQRAMVNVYKEAQNKLSSLQEEDSRHRDAFMVNNAQFLPMNLWMGIQEQSPLYDLQLTLKDIPKVNKNALETAIRNLKS